MSRILQIDMAANWGSHGRIAEEIGQMVMSQNWESYIAYGRYMNPSKSNLIHIGNPWDVRWHGIQSRILDNHGLASKHVTKNFIKKVIEVKPDIIHLHNIHGYFINYRILFDFLSTYKKPVVWTLHDCWSFTGHCSHFTYIKCDKWKTHCYNCKEKGAYPKSLLLDRSERNYNLKKESFTSIANLTIVPVSLWLADIVRESFMGKYQIKMINNGIDIDRFNITTTKSLKTILGVCSTWTNRKGLGDFIKLRELLDESYKIILIGLSKKQIDSLPKNIVGIARTNNLDELIQYYNKATVFVNPTYEDTFPTTNIEALACGTPVITYDTGGSPEIIDAGTGKVVEYGNVKALASTIVDLCENTDINELSKRCRNRAVTLYNKKDRYKEYIELYKSLL